MCIRTRKEILRIEHINKLAGDYHILDDFHLNVYEGEIISLIGLSGCGKEELADVIAGKDMFDSGKFIFNEAEYRAHQLIERKWCEIMTLSQNGVLIPHLTVAENIFIMRRHNPFSVMSSKKVLYEQATAILRKFNVDDILPLIPVKWLTEAQQQVIKLIKAYVTNIKLVVVNNVVDSYTSSDYQLLIRIMTKLKDDGISILWISNAPDAVSGMAERTVIMKEGRNVRTIYYDEYRADIIRDILLQRKSAENNASTQAANTTSPIFQAAHIGAPHISDLEFTVCKGEILGIFDTDNRSLNELEQIITGHLASNTSKMQLCGKAFKPYNLGDAIRNSLGYIGGVNPEQAIFTNLSVLENILIPVLKRTSRFRMLINHKIVEYVKNECVNNFEGLAQRDIDSPPNTLSHFGKQQIIYNRWLLYSPKAILCVEPFAHMDVLEKSRLHKFYNNFKENDTGVLILSVSISDLCEFCDSIIVLKNGTMTGQFKKVDFEKIDFFA